MAIAAALRLPDAYFAGLSADFARKRDRLLLALEGAGLRTLSPDGSYFIMTDTSSWGFADDFEFCRHLTRDVGVAAIPPSAFYSDEHKAHGRTLARFAFCKTDAVLDAAAARLKSRGR